MKLKILNLLKPLGTIIKQNYWSFSPSELIYFIFFNMRHPVGINSEHCTANFFLPFLCMELSLAWLHYLSVHHIQIYWVRVIGCLNAAKDVDFAKKRGPLVSWSIQTQSRILKQLVSKMWVLTCPHLALIWIWPSKLGEQTLKQSWLQASQSSPHWFFFRIF